jgi:hypothetical protein
MTAHTSRPTTPVHGIAAVWVVQTGQTKPAARHERLFLETAGVLPARRTFEDDDAKNFQMFETFDAMDNYSTTPHHLETDRWYH